MSKKEERAYRRGIIDALVGVTTLVTLWGLFVAFFIWKNDM